MINKVDNFRWEVMKFVKLGSQKFNVFNNLQNEISESVRFLIEASLKYCVLRGSFSEMFDNLARIYF